MSRLDRLYRKVIITGFFKKGWGDPAHIRELLQFRLTLGDPTDAYALQITKWLTEGVTVNVEKETRHGSTVVVDASFESPLATFRPNLMVEACKTARFQFMYDEGGSRESWDRPVALHLAGTGDHGFYRRRILQGNPLLKDHGISSVFIENPFYGCRKPKDQLRSSVHYVNDIFVMGAALILETWVVLDWLQKRGFGPSMCLTGVSMGGFMASLAAGFWRRFPIALVPCLSWSSAAPVYTQGVLSEALPWKRLTAQYKSDPAFREINQAMCNGEFGAKYIHGSRRAQPEVDVDAPAFVPSPSFLSSNASFNLNVSSDFVPTDGSLPSSGLPHLTQEPVSTSPSNARKFSTASTDAARVKVPWRLSRRRKDAAPASSSVDEDSRDFMRNLMDQFTHLGNYATPMDPTLTRFLVATRDAYVPSHANVSFAETKRKSRATLSGTPSEPRYIADDIREVWRGCTAEELRGYGHVGAYLLKQKEYSKTIKQALDDLRDKHFL